MAALGWPRGRDGLLKDQPVDRYNHARKAISYFLCWQFGMSEFEPAGPTPGVADRFATGRRGTRGKRRFSAAERRAMEEREAERRRVE